MQNFDSSSRPLFVEVGNRFINVSSIAYVERMHTPRGDSIYLYLNVCKPDGKLQRIEILEQDEAVQIGNFIDSHLFGNYESQNS